MNKIQIKPALFHALSNLQDRSFTVGELTKHYVNRPDCLHKSMKPARQFVYRNLVRLMKCGILDKLPDDGGWPKYELNDKFNSIQANGRLTLSSPPSPSSRSPAKTDTTNRPGRPYKILRDRLNKHRSEMLCAIGEAEEYESLCKEVPELSEEAQTLYNEARERSSLLLGKIKALECLLIPHDVR